MILRTAGLVAAAALAASTWAQTGSAPTLYRLDAASTAEEGCQPPCACPIAWTDDLFGTQTVRFDHSDPAWFDHYAIDDVNWLVDLFGTQRRVTGSGTYEVGGNCAPMHQLQLDLSIDANAAQHRLICDLTDANGLTRRFDSGLVDGGAWAPARIDIDLAANGFYGYDQVFRLHARP